MLVLICGSCHRSSSNEFEYCCYGQFTTGSDVLHLAIFEVISEWFGNAKSLKEYDTFGVLSKADKVKMRVPIIDKIKVTKCLMIL